MRITFITGRNAGLVREQVRRLQAAATTDHPVEVLVHPWAMQHPADGKRQLLQMLRTAGRRHLVFVSFQDWIVTILGEAIEQHHTDAAPFSSLLPDNPISKDDVEVVFCEGSQPSVHTFNDKGYVQDWPIGYFTAYQDD